MGGTSYALSGGYFQHGQLSGCVGPRRVLQTIKPGEHCRRGETAIAWTVAGPPGARGQQDPAAAAGQNGRDGQGITAATLTPGDSTCSAGGTRFTAGADAVFACNGAAGPIGPSDAYANANVGTGLGLPAGGYLAIGRATLSAATASTANCGILKVDDSVVDMTTQSVAASASPTVTIVGPVHLTLADTLRIYCNNLSGSVSDSQATAIRVGALHTQ